MTAGQEVQMNMEHGLSRSGSIVDDHPVALAVEAFVGGNLLRYQEQVSDKLLVSFGHTVYIGDVFFRYDKRVNGRLRVYVFKGGRQVVFIHDR